MATNSNQTRNTGAASGKRANATKREARKRRKIIIVTVEIVILLAMVGLLCAVYFMGGDEGPSTVVIPEEKLEIQEEVVDNPTMKGYMNVALFGVDAMNKNQLYKDSRSDSIMIANINMDTGDIKLVSVYRDTYLNLGNDKYGKCNSAYSKGGAEQAMKMLNLNLDMDIKNFITIGYKGMVDMIDGLGGIMIDVDSEELKHINNYQRSIVDFADWGIKDYTKVTEPGYQLLNGLQATAYCRIRATAGDDFKRTARQREVIMAIEDKAKQSDLAALTKVFNNVIDNVYTNIESDDILELLSNINNYSIVEEGGFPEENMRTTGNIGADGSCVIPMDLTANVVWLHQFLFEDQSYEVTESVKECSERVEADTSKYLNKQGQ